MIACAKARGKSPYLKQIKYHAIAQNKTFYDYCFMLVIKQISLTNGGCYAAGGSHQTVTMINTSVELPYAPEFIDSIYINHSGDVDDAMYLHFFNTEMSRYYKPCGSYAYSFSVKHYISSKQLAFVKAKLKENSNKLFYQIYVQDLCGGTIALQNYNLYININYHIK